MALSEHEQRMLDELERGLYASDSNFAAKVANKPGRVPASRIVLGALLAVIGVSLLVFAVIIQLIVFGVVGFLVTLVGLVIGSSNWSSSALQPGAAPKPGSGPAGSSGKGQRSSLGDFFESRWDQRNRD